MITSWLAYGLLLIVDGGLLIWFGGYFFLIGMILLIVLPIVSYFLVNLGKKRIEFHILETDGQYFILIQQAFLPIGELDFDVHISNIFMQSHTEFNYKTCCKRSSKILLQSNHELGKVIIEIRNIQLRDMTGLFSSCLTSHMAHEYINMPSRNDQALRECLNQFEMNVQRTRNNVDMELEDQHEVREYQPKDSLKYLHHKISNKLDKNMIRVFAPVEDDNMILALDLSWNEKECAQVLGLLLCLGEYWQNYNKTILIIWLSRNELKTCKMNHNYLEVINQILSSPKAALFDQTLLPDNCWILLPERIMAPTQNRKQVDLCG